ncbi:TDT family transporter [Vagococcus coleopterorum]|nr:TDT family transporter [Vagococcus coleopterorum]
MHHFFKNLPIPMGGLALALLSIGNLFRQYDLMLLSHLAGTFGFILLVLLLLKVLLTPKETLEQLKQPMLAAVAPTITMATMVGTTYLNRFESLHVLALIIWYLSLTLQVLLMLYFTYVFLVKRKWSWHNFYPSWFILYIGIGIIPITGQAFSHLIGEISLLISLILYIIFLPMVLYRVLVFKQFDKSATPLIAITCAPSSLILTGYLAAHDSPNKLLLVLWLILAQGLYFLVLYLLPKIIPTDFYPSWSGLTFPFVICATGLKASAPHFNGLTKTLLSALAYAELIIAAVMVALVLIKYLNFLANLIQTKKHA